MAADGCAARRALAATDRAGLPQGASLACLPPPRRQRQRIKYLHANMESTGLPDASFDLVAVQFVTQECPAHVIDNLVGPGGRR